MDKDLILSLPDEAFYNLLLVIPLENVIQFKNVYYEERKEVFEVARIRIAKDLDVPTDFSFVQIKEYEEKEDDEDKALFLITIGDYPMYVDKLADQLDDLSYLIEEAIDEKRDYTTLALLSREGVDKADYFLLVVAEKLYESTSYLVNQINVEDALGNDLFTSDGYLSQGSLKWLLETFDFPLSSDFITKYLSLNYHQLLNLLLQHTTKEEIREAYKQHLESLQTRMSYYGGDYLIDLSQAERDRVIKTFQQYIYKLYLVLSILNFISSRFFLCTT